MADLSFSHSISIAAPAAAVWNALVAPEVVNTYYLAPLQVIELKAGGTLAYGTEENIAISGTIVEFEPDKKLVHTFRFGRESEAGADSDPATIVTYLLSSHGEHTTVTLTHSGFPDQNQTYADVSGGWPIILDGLKNVLEQTR